MEIFTRLSEKDGSADLQYHYRVDEEDIFVEASLSDDISEVSRLNQEGSGKNPKKVYTI